jgi:hypothetical protein
VDLLYAPRKQGGRGLNQLQGAYLVEITKAVEYVGRKEDPLLQIVRIHQHISLTVLQTARLLSAELQGETRQIQDSIAEKTKERWRAKRMHEQLSHNLEEELDDKQSFR